MVYDSDLAFNTFFILGEGKTWDYLGSSSQVNELLILRLVIKSFKFFKYTLTISTCFIKNHDGHCVVNWSQKSGSGE